MFKIFLWGIEVFFYVLEAIVSIIVNIKQKKSATNYTNSVIYNTIETNTDIAKNEETYIDDNNYKKYGIAEPTDLEYSMTVVKIQDLYEKCGFTVKVTDIKKNKYTTEYELIFDRKYTQDQLLAISANILDEFVIDGTNIKPNKKEKNRISVLIPFEYKEVNEETLT